MSKDMTLSDEKEKQTKAIWDDVTLNSFIQVCVAETLKGNRPNCHFSKIGWRNVIKNFNEKTGRNYGYRQLKNKWTSLKKDWQVWNKLVESATGLGWDHLRQTIDATSEWWDDQIKVVPEAAKYHAKGLHNVDQLDILFKDVVVTGEGAWAPSQGFVSKAVSDRAKGFTDDTIGGETEINENEFNNVESTTNDANDVDTGETHAQGREKRRKKFGLRGGSSKMSDKLDRLCDIIEYRRRDLPRCNILEVMETLTSLPGIEEEMSYMIDDNDDINSTSDDSDNEQFDRLVEIGCTIVMDHFETYVDKEPCRTSFYTGFKFVREVLNGHDVRCHQQFRMEKHVFTQLLITLNQYYDLKSSSDMPLEEALAMFFITLGHRLTNRMIHERFQHSGEIVSRWFSLVLDVVCRLAVDIIKPSDQQFRATPSKIKNDNRYWSYFKNCIGAIDGTHISVVTPKDKKIPYIGRKGITTQNIMVVCDFNMCFTFTWVGWEGAAHDSRIFMEALRSPHLNFPHPPKGKYYLVDAGYPQMKGYLGPYKGERYHLPDFPRGSQPRGKKEIFTFILKVYN